jgi:hypothetical protein
MTYPKGDCEYLVRTLAATMLDLSADDRAHVLRYLAAELERLDLIDPAAALAGLRQSSSRADVGRN